VTCKFRSGDVIPGSGLALAAGRIIRGWVSLAPVDGLKAEGAAMVRRHRLILPRECVEGPPA